ncbi:MAG: HD domain-containing protein [Acidobacteria bacterium]|nr:HD domain-containing protein [Acidobacteriota bacterium]
MPARILIAENDDGARGVLAGWLEEAGYLCVQTDAREALSAARRHPLDAAVVGVGIPDDGGMFVVRALRTQADQVGVVVVSTPPDFDVAVAASRLGAVDCLPWPSSSDTVVDSVRRAVEWRTATQATRQSSHRLTEEVAAGREHLKATIRRVDPESVPAVLLAVLEARSPETHDHSNRVSKSAAALAGTYNLPPIDILSVKRAALLHDIGKIAIPDRLLAETGPLGDADLALLRSHVSIGAEVLASVPALAPIAGIIGATHERYDGTGYPAGLAADDIPLPARIISVADAYDAMTSVRCYSDPVSHDDANAELVRSAGSHFDPDVVRAWLQMTELRRCS